IVDHPLLNHGKGSKKPTISLQKALADAAIVLDNSGVDSPRLDAEILLGKILGISRPQLYARLQEPINPKDLKRFHKLIDKRAHRIPLQHLTGHTEFMSLDFLVKRGIFIPRPETELVVEAVLERANVRAGLKILDIGTGCGNIAVSIAVGLQACRGGVTPPLPRQDVMVYASDISSKALKLARLNAKRHNVEAKVSFHKGSVYQAFQGLGLEGEIDFIASNPPYVPQSEWGGLQPEVRDYEDPRALVAGKDGLECYRKIVVDAHRWLRQGGWLILELGENQAASVKDLIHKDGHFRETKTTKDLQGIERIIIAKSG
ncbi:MAG: peptide chain release factor N(5)-glutamine methyltransferase, partial [Candidatus Brocadiales bacterium]